MQETAWDTALAPHPAGCCKDRAAARPDPCDCRGVGHFLRGPAGSLVMGAGSAADGLGGLGAIAKRNETEAESFPETYKSRHLAPDHMLN